MNKTKKKFDARTIEGRLHLKRSDAARRAWITIRANRAAAKRKTT